MILITSSKILSASFNRSIILSFIISPPLCFYYIIDEGYCVS
nr:MAG TPA: hypothetical protein [Caudoviricetes sp.]